MKSIRAFVVFAVALAGGASTVVAGCSSSTSSGGSGASPASCPAICTRSTAAKCAKDPDCLTTCQTAVAKVPAGCVSQWNTLSACLQSATFTCDASGESAAAACETQQTAYATCFANPPATLGGLGGDAGTGTGTGTGTDAGAGTGTGTGAAVCLAQTGDDACLACIRTSCCAELAACTNDASCSSVASCAANCDNDTCSQACLTQNPSGASLYNATINCSSQKCGTPCSGSDTTSTGTGTGSTGTGTTGTTPANCYDVPAGTTGYCENTGRSVIQDCPNGAPYPDCVRAPDGSSGIWCCNE